MPPEVSEDVFEAAAPTVEEAVSIALARAGLPRDQALVDVLSQGGETLPGERVSAAEARVRV
ncbi:MAG: Jag N-terminal domain-containing protein, partial [Candidatus Dormibacteria bacterium]